jgi:hypothetical protein
MVNREDKMNAYELADEIDNFLKEEEQLPWGTKQVYLDMASTMIRQQAKRIEELEEQLHWLVQNPLKELSDDEIAKITMYSSDMNEYGHSRLDELAFARAIIKASRGEE